MNFLKKRIQSFGFAFSGIYEAIRQETHHKLHLTATALVICAGFYFHISSLEWILVSLCIGLVMALELVNSAIERLCNRLLPEHNSDVKFIKDVAAAAVLVAATVSLITAVLIFTPYLMR